MLGLADGGGSGLSPGSSFSGIVGGRAKGIPLFLVSPIGPPCRHAALRLEQAPSEDVDLGRQTNHSMPTPYPRKAIIKAAENVKNLPLEYLYLENRRMMAFAKLFGLPRAEAQRDCGDESDSNSRRDNWRLAKCDCRLRGIADEQRRRPRRFGGVGNRTRNPTRLQGRNARSMAYLTRDRVVRPVTLLISNRMGSQHPDFSPQEVVRANVQSSETSDHSPRSRE